MALIARSALRTTVAAALLVVLPAGLAADTVRVPGGTTIYCVLDQDLTTRRKSADFVLEGDYVRALVAEDVIVDGRVVIAAGAVVHGKVSRAKRAKIAGVRGKLRVAATSVTGVDQQAVALRGGYDRSGKGRVALAASLAAVVAWPLIFIKGKQAHLPRGVVFDAQTAVPIEVEVGPRRPVLRVDSTGLEAEILYDDIDPGKKIRTLPIGLTGLPDDPPAATVIAVNGEAIPEIAMTLAGNIAHVRFKELSSHFRQGLNRFTVAVADETAEVLLEIEF